MAIKDASGRYLQKYDNRWSCWLFPYIASDSDANKASVDVFVGELLKEDISTSYVTHSVHCKYSVSDNVYKIYNHKLYQVILDDISEHIS